MAENNDTNTNNQPTKFKRVCVFCGSNTGFRQVFSDAAIDLGNELVCSFCLSLAYPFFLKKK